MKPLFVILIFSVSLVLSSRLAIGAAKGSVAPGTYQDWGGEIDEVVVLTPVSVPVSRIDVVPIRYDGVELPSQKDNTYQAVREVLGHSMNPFMRGLHEKIASNIVIREGEPNRKLAPTLLLRIRITQIDPGSQAARYRGGFGAGAARVEITGEILDERQQAVVATFRQGRKSGVGLLGGGYHALLDRTLKQIGGDIAGLLNAICRA